MDASSTGPCFARCLKIDQVALFELVARYSTFTWVRIDETGLALPTTEARRCFARARCIRGDVPAGLISFRPEGTVRAPELDDLKRAREALLARHGAEFVPGELRKDQAAVLMAAARSHARERRFAGPLEMTSLVTEFLAGGHSVARIALLRVNGDGASIIAKVAEKTHVADEMLRFRTYVQEWDDALRPTLHFHHDAAVILFGLVPDERDRRRPAKVLSEELDDLWTAELFGPDGEIDERAASLRVAVENAARRLGELNQRRPPASGPEGRGNPYVPPIIQRETMDWGIVGLAEGIQRAQAQLQRLSAAATLHGDVHLRNILVRAQRDAYLIDYAASGPGHPAVDLARLEVALFVGSLQQVEGEHRCEEFQRRLTLNQAGEQELRAHFGALHAPKINGVVVAGCIAARDRALEVVGAYGGSTDDYLAAKYLVAVQNLGMPGLNRGLARATVVALTPAACALPVA